MSKGTYTGRIKPVEEYTGWALYPEVAETKGIRPLAKWIDHGADGGESLAKRMVDCWNAFVNLSPEQAQIVSSGMATLSRENNELKALNAEMLDAIEAALPLLEKCAATHLNGEVIYKQALEAINKSKRL